MAWRIEILPAVRAAINGLSASGALSRGGWIGVYNALYYRLPGLARSLQTRRYAADPNYFIYRIRFNDRGIWRRFTFYVNDTRSPGLLVVEDVEHETFP